ncbi:peptidase P60 [Nitratireductor mangrovi]|uniref:Peptidase P60 n=1 Tax=Nitratireductor mangrovi TaxID=2599600 RepID=A0A5B8KTW5_9HYPH|nr:peptidase P60 [Nitratireductor mangrovi]QDY99055.1 peptidase P60 [Nitratireductor mangrovi]
MTAAASVTDRLLIVAAARGWIGTPYVHQASVRGAGCDCLGLLRGIWREIVGPEPEAAPPYSPGWAEVSGRETLLETARRHLVEIAIDTAAPGSVLLFRWRPDLPVKHCGIVSAPGRMVHAYERAGVTEIALPVAWRRRLAAAFDFPKAGGRS